MSALNFKIQLLAKVLKCFFQLSVEQRYQNKDITTSVSIVNKTCKRSE